VRARLLILLAMLACRRADPPGSGSAGGPRLVSLSPSATEIIAALGAADELVGVDDYSKYPPSVAELPKIGSFLSPNIEAIVRLAPTLVIIDDVHGRAAGALHDAGVKTVECAIHSLSDVERGLRTVGAQIGRSDVAERVVGDIERALATARTQHAAQGLRVLAIIDREAGGTGGLVAGGPGSYVDELLHVLGAENVIVSAGDYPRIGIEDVIRAKPDVVLDLSFGGDPGVWASVTPARVVAAQEPYLVAPSPRVTVAIERLAQLLR
jgi:iron complex transport system substrate-binding protein